MKHDFAIEEFDFEPVDEYGLYRSEWAAEKQKSEDVDVVDFDEKTCALINAAPAMYNALKGIHQKLLSKLTVRFTQDEVVAISRAIAQVEKRF